MVQQRLKKSLEGYFFPELRDLVVNAGGDTGYGEWIIFEKEEKNDS